MTIYDQDREIQRPGGGTITFRVVLSAVAGITLYLLQSFGSHMVSQLDTLNTTQNRMAVLLAKQVQLNSDTADVTERHTIRLDDHEHRITVLESRPAR